jgi:hypothetical protein
MLSDDRRGPLGLGAGHREGVAGSGRRFGRRETDRDKDADPQREDVPRPSERGASDEGQEGSHNRAFRKNHLEDASESAHSAAARRRASAENPAC